jgi:hypothetical protein
VRTENIYLIRAVAGDDPSPPEVGPDEEEQFFEFHSFTVSPIQTKCVLPELLTPLQLNWLNDYNARVRATLLAEYASAPAARWVAWDLGQEEVEAFLLRETEPVPAAAPAARL